MAQYELDGKIYDVNEMQARTVDRLFLADTEEATKQAKQIIRKRATRVFDEEGTVEEEVDEPESGGVFQGTASSGDLI